jgi:hypothetical protein
MHAPVVTLKKRLCLESTPSIHHFHLRELQRFEQKQLPPSTTAA